MKQRTAEKNDKTCILIFIFLFCAAFFLCLSSCLSPFGNMMIDADTSVYLTIARGITEGKVPFRDFFDNKGPILYLINALGMLFGFTGVWVIEIAFMFISVFFAYKTALFFGSRFSSFLGVIFSLLILRMFFYEVAGPAEYSIPFTIISLYIFSKYYFSEGKPSFFEFIILGFCFSVSVLMRINLFSLWLSFCLVIITELLIKHKILFLFKYFISFIAGILVVIIPVYFYLSINNALSDFISQNLFSGSSRAFLGFSIKETIKNFYIIIEKNYCFIPFVIGSFWIIK